jgi:hypothetical protein
VNVECAFSANDITSDRKLGKRDVRVIFDETAPALLKILRVVRANDGANARAAGLPGLDRIFQARYDAMVARVAACKDLGNLGQGPLGAVSAAGLATIMKAEYKVAFKAGDIRWEQ